MKKALALLQTDKHLHKDNISLYKSASKQALQICKEKDINLVIDLGDRLDSRISQPEITLNTLTEDIEEYSAEGIEQIQIPGNHDKTDYNSEYSFLDSYKFHPNFYLFQNGRYKFFEKEKIIFCFLPFFEDTKNNIYLDRLNLMNEALLTFPDYRKFLFTHVAIDGVVNNGSMLVGNSIKQELFSNFEKVFVGHYHDKQKVGKNIYYIGSNYPQSFGEDNEKGFTILYEDGSHEFIKANFPEYRTFELNLDSEYTIPEKHPINHERIILLGSDEKIKTFDENTLKKIGFKVEKKFKSKFKANLTSEITSFSVEDIFLNFQKFCLEKNISFEIGVEYLKKQIHAKNSR